MIWIVFFFSKNSGEISVFFSVFSGCHFHLQFVFLSDENFMDSMQDRKAPIMQTSAKSHIGHLEANAGQAGIIKCTLEMDFVLIFQV